MLERIRQDFVSVVNLSSSMKTVDTIYAIRSQYEYGTEYSTSFEGYICVSRFESRETYLAVDHEDCGSQVASIHPFQLRLLQ